MHLLFLVINIIILINVKNSYKCKKNDIEVIKNNILIYIFVQLF